MKKSLTGAVVLLAGAFMAHSQGTVGFGNYLSFSSGSYMYVTLNGTKIGGASGNGGSATADVGNGNEWTVALYGAAGSGVAASSLLPLIDSSIPNNTTIPVTADLADGGASDSSPGTWYSGDAGAVPGAFNGGAATVQVYAWYNANGTITSYAMAQANEPAGLSGFSSTANVTLGGPFLNNTAPPGLPAALPGGMGNISLNTVPEPSTIALGVMGASAFLMRLRKKQ